VTDQHIPDLGAGGGREVERLIFFSDAVMAIAMTLLVIDLKLPESLGAMTSDADLRAALDGLGPRFLSVLLSFAVIAIWWNGHNRIFRNLERADGALVVLNLVFLGAIAFLPFPTALIGRYVDRPSAVVLYAATNLVAGSALLAMRWHADRRGFVEVESGIERRRRLVTAAIAPIAFGLTIPMAFVDASLAALAWMLLVPAGIAVRWWFERAERRGTAAAAERAPAPASVSRESAAPSPEGAPGSGPPSGPAGSA
jgi:uncharacterized membrane protein